jgi:hypothetical protein
MLLVQGFLDVHLFLLLEFLLLTLFINLYELLDFVCYSDVDVILIDFSFDVVKLFCDLVALLN